MPDEFWTKVWSETSRDATRHAIESYHAATIRMIRALAGRPRTYAEEEVMTSKSGPTITDEVHGALGRSTDQRFNPAVAGFAAIRARHRVYNAALEDPKYDELSDEETRKYYRKTKKRAEWDILEEIENASMVVNQPVDLGRP
jgi:hypothetical protein